MTHLNRVELKPNAPRDKFPFDLPLVRRFETLEFENAVTFFNGEDGTGKSTYLEALAASANLAAAGGFDIERDESLSGARELGKCLRLGWTKRTHRGFFLRAEDFFRFQHRINQSQRELGALADSYEAEL